MVKKKVSKSRKDNSKRNLVIGVVVVVLLLVIGLKIGGYSVTGNQVYDTVDGDYDSVYVEVFDDEIDARYDDSYDSSDSESKSDDGLSFEEAGEKLGFWGSLFEWLFGDDSESSDDLEVMEDGVEGIDVCDPACGDDEVCQEGVCVTVISGSDCTGQPDGTICDSPGDLGSANGICQTEICLRNRDSECVGATDGDSCQFDRGDRESGVCLAEICTEHKTCTFNSNCRANGGGRVCVSGRCYDCGQGDGTQIGCDEGYTCTDLSNGGWCIDDGIDEEEIDKTEECLGDGCGDENPDNDPNYCLQDNDGIDGYDNEETTCESSGLGSKVCRTGVCSYVSCTSDADTGYLCSAERFCSYDTDSGLGVCEHQCYTASEGDTCYYGGTGELDSGFCELTGTNLATCKESVRCDRTAADPNAPCVANSGIYDFCARDGRCWECGGPRNCAIGFYCTNSDGGVCLRSA